MAYPYPATTVDPVAGMNQTGKMPLPTSPGVPTPGIPFGGGGGGLPTPQTPKGLTFTGVGSAWKKKGRDALTEFETRLGRTTTPAEREQMRQMIGYTDLTGEADVLGNQFDQWQQYAALHTPNATWTPWAQPTTPGPTTPTPTTPTPNPRPWSGVGSAPPFTPPPIPGPFQAPTAESVLNEPGYAAGLRQGQESLEGGAAAAGILRTGKTLGDLARYGQEYSKDAYNQAYNRAAQQYGMELGRYTQQFDAERAKYDPVYADWANRQRQAELEFERDWQKQIYGTDAAWREKQFEWQKGVYGTEDEYRRARDKETDAWKRYVMEEERRRWLAEMGTR